VGYRSNVHYENVINHVGSHWTGSWVFLTKGVDTVKKEISTLTPGNASRFSGFTSPVQWLHCTEFPH